MRDYAWRKYKEEIKVKKRLRRQLHFWWRPLKDINNILGPADWYNFIGLPQQHMFKTYTTTIADSRYKAKYSPNRNKGYWRNIKKRGNGRGCGLREKDKNEFKKIINGFYD